MCFLVRLAMAAGVLAMVSHGAAQNAAGVVPAPKAGDARVVDMGGGVALDLIWIPPGVFRMGSPFGEEGRFIAEGRRHQVTLTRGFWMGKFPVTQQQWERVMGNNPSHAKGPRLPVDQVNWNDCQTFIQALNRILATKDLTASLPAEAQWEYACRAGSETRFWSGDRVTDLARVAWFADNSDDQAHEVGRKPANPWGLCDMHGNVWQWCQDWLERYPPEDATDPQGPAAGQERILRGGAWNSEADICRAAYRFSYPPDYRIMTAGLRVVVAAVDHR